MTPSTAAAPPVHLLRNARPWLIALAVIVVAAAAIGFPFLAANWPYRYRKIKPMLEDIFGSQVAIAHYHRTYFPHPGFMATDITLRRKTAADQPPIGTVKSLYVQGSWIDLLMLRERLQLVHMTGVHVVLPAPGSRALRENFPPGSSMDFTGSNTMIERLEVHDSQLDIQRVKGGSFSFPIHELKFRNVQKGHAVDFTLAMDNAIPSGQIRAAGKFGPLNGQALGSTLLSGNYTFAAVNLHDVGNVRGTLSSAGEFHGRVDAIDATGTSHTPDFAVDDAKSVAVDGAVRATINALNGDVVLRSIEIKTGATTIQVNGSVAGSPKVTRLDVAVAGGRAQDLLRPFLHDEVPITGSLWLRSHVLLDPSSQGTFLQRLHVDGAFDVPAERITNAAAEKNLSAFSERAQGLKTSDASNSDARPTDATDAVSSIKGPATIRDAVVSTRNLTFQVAGAQATLDGTFNLHTSAAHLTGNLVMQSDISHATTGFKSFLLKPIAPFFKKKKAGAVVPIAITGTPGHYQVSQDITHTK